MVDLLLSFGVPALFCAAWPRATGRSPEERMAMAAALALGWTQLGAMLLLSFALLTPAAVLAWLGLGVLLAAPWRARPAANLGLLALLPILGMAVVPPWYRDELVYHLALPQQMAAAHAWVHPDDNVFASFPLGWESIVSVAYTLGLPNPRLLGAWTMGAAALGVGGLARRIGGNGAAATAAFLLVPTVQEFGASAYVEPYLTLLTVLALRDLLDRRWTAGLWAGLAASTKYPGLAVVLFVVLLLPREARVRALGAAVLVGCPFYVRNLVERGNPVFPLLYATFGGRGWDDTRAWAYGVTLGHYGAGRDAVDWLLLVPRLLTTRDLHHTFQGSVGPVGLLALLSWKKAPRLAAFALLWTLWWALTVQQVRFWLPALGVLVALSARRPLLLVLGSLVWSAGPIAELWRFQHTTELWTGAMTPDAVRDALLPESAAIYRDLPALVPEDGRVWLVWMRGYTLDFPRPYREDLVFEGWRLEAALDSPHPAASLRGFTHLLVNGRFFLTGTSADWDEPGRTARLRAAWAALQEQGVVTPVRTWGPVTLYAVTPTAP